MSSILYYSTYCPNSKSLLKNLADSSIKNDIHFVNIDQRVAKKDGTVHVILHNGQELLLPPNVTKVPALLLLNHGHKILFGEEIIEYLKPKQIELSNVANHNNGEPLAYSLQAGATYGYGVASDTYSFLDQKADELKAKGNGGMRQTWHYSTLDKDISIETPPDTYEPDKVKQNTLTKYEKERNNDVQLSSHQ